MTLEIALTLGVIVLTLVAFVREWGPPDVISLSVLCLVAALGLVPIGDITEVFKNEAPLAIAALFVIGGAIEKSGALDDIARIMRNSIASGPRGAILGISLIAAFFSAWMNNTAIVAILLPVTLAFARSKDIPSSRLLIPLSYASILGGCCTLIGTSTNLLVNGVLRDLGARPMSMFEIAPIGIPLALASIGFLSLFGPRLLPARASITGTLDTPQRATFLHHILVEATSRLVGQPLVEGLAQTGMRDLHVFEVRRGGQRLTSPLDQIVVQRYDRLLLAFHEADPHGPAPSAFFAALGVTELATIPGLLTELVVLNESSLSGHSLSDVDFRQRYGAVVYDLLRRGVHIDRNISDIPIETGDTLLVLTPAHNLNALRESRDFILTDIADPPAPAAGKPSRRKAHLAWAAIFVAVAAATVSDSLHRTWPGIPLIPIHFSALAAALALIWMRVITPREAYSSIDWQVLFMLYGLLGLGMAMQKTGTAKWLADLLMAAVAAGFTPDWQPIAALWLAYLLTLCLTEVLSNNATAVMMVPIVFTLAHSLGVDPRPFIIAVTVAASAAFALPMGYQTHLMVFGPGGYRFSDFLKAGIPLNLLCWVVSCLLIPLIWPFYP